MMKVGGRMNTRDGIIIVAANGTTEPAGKRGRNGGPPRETLTVCSQ